MFSPAALGDLGLFRDVGRKDKNRFCRRRMRVHLHNYFGIVTFVSSEASDHSRICNSSAGGQTEGLEDHLSRVVADCEDFPSNGVRQAQCAIILYSILYQSLPAMATSKFSALIEIVAVYLLEDANSSTDAQRSKVDGLPVSVVHGFIAEIEVLEHVSLFKRLGQAATSNKARICV
jgi:hypothetical protein